MTTSAYTAATQSVAYRDLSHFGLFRVGGAEAAALLHHLTTGDVKKLAPGHSLDAALVNNKARLLDVVTVVRPAETPGQYLVLTSPNRRELFAPHARKFVLYRQDVTIEDITGTLPFFSVFGPQAPALAAELLPGSDGLQVGDIARAESPVLGAPVSLAATVRLPGGGYFVWGAKDNTLGSWLKERAPAVDGDTYNVLRVEAGLPAAGFELTEANNPWEAGLDAAISLAKGCYNGQEVIARLHTYKKVKQHLRGVKLAAPIPMGQTHELKLAGKAVGTLTSSVESPRFGAIGLGYVRSAHETAGTELEVFGADGAPITTAIVANIPFGA